MATVRESATIHAPRVGEDALSADAYLLWAAVSRKKPANAVRKFNHGISGWDYEGSFTDIILLLWPELSSNEAKDKMKAFRSDVYKYLRATKNAVCTSNFTKGRQVTWWISDVWTSSHTVTLIHSVQPKKSENKLTPHEAGEDREPEMVTTTNASVPYKQGRRERLAEEHDIMGQLTLEFITKEAGGEPITAIEVASLLDVHSTTGRKIVGELVVAGKLFGRYETTDERELRFGQPVRATPSTLYSHLNPVPPRTKREVVPGYTAEFNIKPEKVRSKGALEPIVFKVVNTRWQTVAQIADRIPRLDQANARTVLKRLVSKKLVESSMELDEVQNRYMQKYRLPGGKGQAARDEAQVETTYTDDDRLADQRGQLTNPLSEPKPFTPVIVESDEALVTSIQSLVTNYVQQFKKPAVDLDYVKQLERENGALRAEVDKLNGVLAPLRQLLQGS